MANDIFKACVNIEHVKVATPMNLVTYYRSFFYLMDVYQS